MADTISVSIVSSPSVIPLSLVTVADPFVVEFGLALTGAKGDDGTDGTDGVDGINGTNGTNGTNGENGTNGTNGTNGVDGNDNLFIQDAHPTVTKPSFWIQTLNGAPISLWLVTEDA